MLSRSAATSDTTKAISRLAKFFPRRDQRSQPQRRSRDCNCALTRSGELSLRRPGDSETFREVANFLDSTDLFSVIGAKRLSGEGARKCGRGARAPQSGEVPSFDLGSDRSTPSPDYPLRQRTLQRSG